MQKTELGCLIREELTRALVFGVGFLTVLSLGFISIASAASGGIFGDILNRILASGNWESPGDGTVKNADKLGNVPASSFVKVQAGQSCPATKCITGFQPDGTVSCTP